MSDERDLTDNRNNDSNPGPAATQHNITNPQSQECIGEDKQTRPIERVGAILLFFTLIATAFAAKYAGRQAYIAGEQERWSLRAYVSVPALTKNHPTLGVVPVVDKQFEGWSGASNDGQTPALNFIHYISIGVYSVPLPKAFSFKTDKTYPRSVLGIHEQVSASINSHGIDMSVHARNFIQRSEALYLYGTITYDDVFGHRHFTNYCVYFYLIGAPNYCDTHNDTDDGPDPHSIASEQ